MLHSKQMIIQSLNDKNNHHVAQMYNLVKMKGCDKNEWWMQVHWSYTTIPNHVCVFAAAQ